MVRDSDIVKYPMTLEAFQRACDRWNMMPKENLEKVFTESPEKTLCGFAAEELIHSLMPNMTPSSNNNVYDYDYLYLGYKMDIKNKCGTVSPRANYEGSIYLYPNLHIPNCDIFLFTRMIEASKTPIFPRGFSLKNMINEDLKLTLAPSLLSKYPNLWLCGFISKSDFLDEKIHFIVRKGEKLAGSSKIADGNTINVFYNKCSPAQILIDQYKANVV